MESGRASWKDGLWRGGWSICGGAWALLRTWKKVMNRRREDQLLPQDQEFQGELWLGPTLETDQNRQETLELGKGWVYVMGWKDSGPRWL